MTIHPRPDQEIRIQEALQAGIIKRAEDVIDAGLEHLRERAMPSGASSSNTKNLMDLLAPIRGMLTNEEVDTLFSRNLSPSRHIDLS